MEYFNRHSVYSKIETRKIDEINEVKGEIVSIGFINESLPVIVEYVTQEDYANYIDEKNSKPVSSKESLVEDKPNKMPKPVADALEMVINYDAFHKGMKGKKLKEIYKSNPEWLDQARAELQNEFVLNKILSIDEFFGGTVWEI